MLVTRVSQILITELRKTIDQAATGRVFQGERWPMGEKLVSPLEMSPASSAEASSVPSSVPSMLSI